MNSASSTATIQTCGCADCLKEQPLEQGAGFFAPGVLPGLDRFNGSNAHDPVKSTHAMEEILLLGPMLVHMGSLMWNTAYCQCESLVNSVSCASECFAVESEMDVKKSGCTKSGNDCLCTCHCRSGASRGTVVPKGGWSECP